MEVPSSVDFDISSLEIGSSAHLGDIALPEGVRLLDDADAVLAAVIQPRAEEEPETAPAEGEAEVAEGEEPAAAEAEAEPADGDTEE